MFTRLLLPVVCLLLAGLSNAQITLNNAGNLPAETGTGSAATGATATFTSGSSVDTVSITITYANGNSSTASYARLKTSKGPYSNGTNKWKFFKDAAGKWKWQFDRTNPQSQHQGYMDKAPSIAVAYDGVVQELSVGVLQVEVDDLPNPQLTYLWTQISGPTVTIQSATSDTASFTAPDLTTDTDFVFRIEVNDGTSTCDTVDVTFTVQADDDAPEANYTGQMFASQGATVQLAVDAWDPEGSSLTYQWSAVNSGDGAFLDDGESETSQFQVDGAATGDIDLECAISDGTNMTIVAVVITIQ